ncbi:hypothetical protein [Ferrovum myxofaciens]|uniref:hypothetical protein n=1 Tax=Ferrovum myxofaciens TaxID=416213 RepID=UPI0023545F84|nr:hypothetical protein [Ferrovum myxofaciens]MBU6995865.1 hypothetical protein [Ferrovum myxofaciens]
MQTEQEKLEIRGRLWLWASAISECKTILNLLRKNEAELTSGRPAERDNDNSEAFQAFAKNQPDYTPGMQKLSHHIAFLEISPSAYPASSDCFHIRNYGQMLAVVLFCQTLNKGNRHDGTVAGNTKIFISTHLDEIVRSLFQTEAEREEFYRLRDVCLVARDQMIGHADGAAFQLEHGYPVSRMNSLHTAVTLVDFEYMGRIMEPLRLAIMDYARRITY